MFFIIPFLIASITISSLQNQPIPASQLAQDLEPYSKNANQSSTQNSSLPKIEIQPLVADAENDVVVLEECDLAIRFNKNNKLGHKIIAEKDKNDDGTFSWLFEHKSKTRAISLLDEKNDGARMDLSIILVECTDNFTKNYDYFFNMLKASKEEIKFSSNCDKKDWFEEFNFSLRGFCGLTEKIILLKVGPGAAPVTNKILMFETKNTTYSIRTFTGLNFDLELQPNSLAPSTPSVKL